mmetsp:Transcript_16739/g.36537  ORF Transcript_16739/g.36537 Transcript_16739/m.36537 type:complete len:242 (-) Transcript_16739:581-1306(-)|eukprot:CAMPEP_0173169318 /NCGR_PEP_ID=MMETSP1141-20130122/640_1 /TAXON_ID=483371 /ORGANISM="non described non described, Strain CCMP2298" /LENGTH=241 /DNA_ID=CAMNT_0014091137 /DNA_START=1122 /DNA_END=1847 /DNA_ORIENTATION=+
MRSPTEVEQFFPHEACVQSVVEGARTLPGAEAVARNEQVDEVVLTCADAVGAGMGVGASNERAAHLFSPRPASHGSALGPAQKDASENAQHAPLSTGGRHAVPVPGPLLLVLGALVDHAPPAPGVPAGEASQQVGQIRRHPATADCAAAGQSLQLVREQQLCVQQVQVAVNHSLFVDKQHAAEPVQNIRHLPGHLRGGSAHQREQRTVREEVQEQIIGCCPVLRTVISIVLQLVQLRHAQE